MTADDRPPGGDPSAESSAEEPPNREPSDQTAPTKTMTDTTADDAPDDGTARGDASRTSRAVDTGGRDSPDGSGLDRLGTDRLRAILDRVGLAALVLLALVAGWSFYGQTGTAIRTWLDPAYQPLALAAFNLAVLLVAVAGIVHQLARIRASE